MLDTCGVLRRETWATRPHPSEAAKSMKRTGLTIAGMAAGAALLWALVKKR